jgi:hypothetical protein
VGEYTRNYRAAKRGELRGEGGELRGEGGELRGEGGELHLNERKSKKKCEVSKVDFNLDEEHIWMQFGYLKRLLMKVFKNF